MSCLEVLYANKWIVEKNLSILTWGNVSKVNREEGQIYIKPSGANLETLGSEDISIVSLGDGSHLSGLSPSVDTKTHRQLYKHFDDVGCVVHTHSTYATAFAQANCSIPCLGTTHADYFFGSIPCITQPTSNEVDKDYEKFTGLRIVNHFHTLGINSLEVPAALVQGHGVFCWGKTVKDALENSIIVEKVAEMAIHTLSLNQKSKLSEYILNKHFLRKHGKNKYYGQENRD